MARSRWIVVASVCAAFTQVISIAGAAAQEEPALPPPPVPPATPAPAGAAISGPAAAPPAAEPPEVDCFERPAQAQAQPVAPAQPGDPYASPFPYQYPWGAMPPPLFADQLHRSGESLRSTGVTLTLAGVGLFALSAVLLHESGDRWRAGNEDASASYALGGVLGILGGLAGLGVGIPLWAVGAHRMSKAESMMELGPLGWTPIVKPVEGGAVAGVRVVAF